MNEKRKELEEVVASARKTLKLAVKSLNEFDRAPEQNVYPDMDTAEGTLEDKLYARAEKACEGSHNVGDDFYEQEFIVADVHYIARLDVEYNRHDKTYYYVDETTFSVLPKETA